ncbi:YegP family protein [Deinococcus frigens]|uniref:YegP family protein n=1 Tax=Deinococcus frigens TaxID=249403 RepID=UPI000495A616|nr:YegP family protein [Deinococcus frigens]
MAAKFVLKMSGDQFMFNLQAGNGQTVLTSERYTTKAAATNGIASVKQNAADSKMYEMTASGKHFNLKAGNGQVIGVSQNYSSEDAARAGMEAVRSAAAEALVDDQTAQG